MLLDGNPIQKVWSAVGWQTLIWGAGGGVVSGPRRHETRDGTCFSKHSIAQLAAGWRPQHSSGLRGPVRPEPGCSRIENGPLRLKPWVTVFPFTSFMFLFSLSFSIR